MKLNRLVLCVMLIKLRESRTFGSRADADMDHYQETVRAVKQGW